MSNAIVPVTPNYLPSLYTEADMKAIQDEFGGGLSVGISFPRIAMKGTRFAIKDDNTEQVLPQSQIEVVIVRARATIDKTWYASRFDPNSDEFKGPDCFSRDGVKPDPTSPIKQADICATCPHNAFGSGTDANGNPSKGKACSDTKQLALFAAGKVYGFKITPASLKAYQTYIKTLAGYNLNPTVVITRIGFDPNFTFPVLTFEYVASLDQAQAQKIAQLRGSQEVEDICGSGQTVSAPALPAPTPAPAPAPVVEPEPTPVAFGAFGPAVDATPAPAAAKPRAAKPKPAATEPAPINVSGPTEADIMAKLGL